VSYKRKGKHVASIGNDPNGCKRILFVAGDGRRKTIRLGKVTLKLAEAVKRRVEALNAAAIAAEPVDDETARWLKKCDQVLLDKLVAAELLEPTRQCRLGDLLAGYSEQRGDVKPATKLFYGHTKRCLLEYFGADRILRHISPGDAEDWRRWLSQGQEGKPESPKLADNTMRRRCSLAKQFFAYAVPKGLGGPQSLCRAEWHGSRQSRAYVLRQPARSHGRLGSVPRCRVAVAVCVGPVRWAAVPKRASGIEVGGCGLGTRTDDDSQPQNRTP
jgi:hypothetical protein